MQGIRYKRQSNAASRSAALLAGVVFAMSGCAGSSIPALGLTDKGTLTDCPARPNCVCTDATAGARHIDGLRVDGDPQVAWQALLVHIEGQPRMRIVDRQERYLRATAHTRLLRFTDDVEFHLRPADGVIAMRSASRIGYSDLGANRKRLESIRAALAAAAAVRAAD